MENEHFKFLLEFLPDSTYIGLGNPNSNILFIGKEAGLDIDSDVYDGNVKSWKDNNNYSLKFVPEKQNLRNMKHTWQRYQKLYELILLKIEGDIKKDRSDKYEITFVENVFTTELSCLPAKKTIEAKRHDKFKSELAKRKMLFFKSDFIDNFPIILIFATDPNYIETFPNEISELFKVKFDKQFKYNGKDKIWIHTSNNENHKKLVIHTRQLTNSIGNNLLATLAEIITDFSVKNSINLFENT